MNEIQYAQEANLLRNILDNSRKTTELQNDYLVKVVRADGFDHLKNVIASGRLFVPEDISFYPVELRREPERNIHPNPYPLGYFQCKADGIVSGWGPIAGVVSFSAKAVESNRLDKITLADLCKAGIFVSGVPFAADERRFILDENSPQGIFINTEGKGNAASLYVGFKSLLPQGQWGRMSVHRNFEKTYALYETLIGFGQRYL